MPTCGSEELLPVDFDFCEPEVRGSEIRRIFIAKMAAAPFTDWEDMAEWQARISADSEDVGAIRELWVIADKPLPVSTIKEISMQRKVIVLKDHTLNITVDETSAINHNFITSIDGKFYRIWYETAGALMFGGNEGIGAQLFADMILVRGSGNVMIYNVVATWRKLTTEARIDSPIFSESDIMPSAIGDTVGTTPPFTLSLSGVNNEILTNDVYGGTWSIDNSNISITPISGPPARCSAIGLVIGTTTVTYRIGSNFVTQLITVTA